MNCPVTADFNRNDKEQAAVYYFNEWLSDRSADIKHEMLSVDGYKAIDGEIIDWQTINQPLDDEAVKQANREYNNEQ